MKDTDERSRLTREALKTLQQGQPLSFVIPKVLEVARLQKNTAMYAWLRLQLFDLDDDKPWNPPPDLADIWREIETECDTIFPSKVRWSIYADYLKCRRFESNSGEPWLVSVTTIEAGLGASKRPSFARVVGFDELQRLQEAVYGRIEARVRSYLGQLMQQAN